MTPLRPSQPRAEGIQSLYQLAPGESFGEKALMAVVAGAAMAAVAYGFGTMLNLVQNWAAFEHGIAQMVR